MSIDGGTDKPGHSLRLLLHIAMKHSSSEGLMGYITDNDLIVRTAAAREIQSRSEQIYIVRISSMLDSEYERDREIAAFIIGQFNFSDANLQNKNKEKLENMLFIERSDDVLVSILSSLGNLADGHFTDQIGLFHNHKSPDVRISVVIALARIIHRENREPSHQENFVLDQSSKDRLRRVREWTRTAQSIIYC